MRNEEIEGQLNGSILRELHLTLHVVDISRLVIQRGSNPPSGKLVNIVDCSESIAGW